MKTGKKEMKAWLVSYRSAFMARGTLRRIGRSHTPKFLVKIGFQRGRASNCNFVHKKRNIKMTVHGDDFFAVADLDQMRWIEEQLKSEYAIKAEVVRRSRSSTDRFGGG